MSSSKSLGTWLRLVGDLGGSTMVPLRGESKLMSDFGDLGASHLRGEPNRSFGRPSEGGVIGEILIGRRGECLVGSGISTVRARPLPSAALPLWWPMLGELSRTAASFIDRERTRNKLVSLWGVRSRGSIASGELATVCVRPRAGTSCPEGERPRYASWECATDKDRPRSSDDERCMLCSTCDGVRLRRSPTVSFDELVLRGLLCCVLRRGRSDATRC